MSRTLSLGAAVCAAAAVLPMLHSALVAETLPAERKIEQTLAEPTQLEFIETPLTDVVDFLMDYHDIQIQLDEKALADAGIEKRTPITANLKGLSLRSALNLILRQQDLTFSVRDEVLLITTPEASQGRLITRVYPVGDLLGPGRAAAGVDSPASEFDFDALIEVITSTVRRESWNEVGGPGSIAPAKLQDVPTLVIAQTYQVHHGIAELLRQQRQVLMAAERPARVPGRAAVPVTGKPETVEKIETALAGPTQLEFIDTPLHEVVGFLRAHHRIEIQIDRRALDDMGVGTDTPITIDVKGISLRSALRLLLRELDLAYVIQDEVLLITTPEEAECRLTTKIYPVGDLLVPAAKPAHFPADGATLMDLITSVVQPTTWEDVGGPGAIRGASLGGVETLIISQTADVHAEITSLLAALRGIIAEQQAPAHGKQPPPAAAD